MVPDPSLCLIATLALSSFLQAFTPSTSSPRRKHHITRGVILLALTASIVRAETALLLFGVILALFFKESAGKTRFELTRVAVVTTVVAGLAGTALSVLVDSYFWSDWLAQNRMPAHVVTASGLRGTLERGLRAIAFGTRWIWPELWGVLFNVVEGKSELWGVRTSSLDSQDAADARCRLLRGILTCFRTCRNYCFPLCRWRWLFLFWIQRQGGP